MAQFYTRYLEICALDGTEREGETQAELAKLGEEARASRDRVAQLIERVAVSLGPGEDGIGDPILDPSSDLSPFLEFVRNSILGAIVRRPHPGDLEVMTTGQCAEKLAVPTPALAMFHEGALHCLACFLKVNPSAAGALETNFVPPGSGCKAGLSPEASGPVTPPAPVRWMVEMLRGVDAAERADGRPIEERGLDASQRKALRQFLAPLDEVPLKLQWFKQEPGRKKLLIILHGSTQTRKHLQLMSKQVGLEDSEDFNVVGVEADIPNLLRKGQFNLPKDARGFTFFRTKNPISRFAERLISANRVLSFIESRTEEVHLMGFSAGSMTIWHALALADRPIAVKTAFNSLLLGDAWILNARDTADAMRRGGQVWYAHGALEPHLGDYAAELQRLAPDVVSVQAYEGQVHATTAKQMQDCRKFLEGTASAL